MHPVFENRKNELAELCKRYDVTLLEVFGSAARGTDFDSRTSDADFLVEFGSDSGLDPFCQFFDFAHALRVVLGRPVDLIEAGTVKSVSLQAAIDRSRELVYAS